MTDDMWDFEYSNPINDRKSYWDNIYLLDAVYWSRKSHDPETQCGCVIVNPLDNTTVAHGYNGFVRGIDNAKLPNTRPNKYPFMIHAEANAIYNAVRQGKSTQGMRVYVTGKPCVACYQMMHQCGIDEIVYTNVSMPKMVENCESFVKIRDVLDLGGPELVFIDKSNLDISFLEEAIREIKK